MKYQFIADRPANLVEDVVVCFTPQVEKVTGGDLAEIDAATGGSLKTLVDSEEFRGKTGQIASFTNPQGYASRRLLLVGLGDEKKLTSDSYRKAMGTVSTYDGFACASTAAVYFGAVRDRAYFQAAIEGCLLGAFKHLDYKSDEKARVQHQPKSISFVVDQKKAVPPMKAAIERGEVIAQGQILVRELAATPSRDLTPKLYARKAQQLARKYGVKCQVLDEKAIAGEKMGALLGVAQGSQEPPRFMILEYPGGRPGQKPVVLVGKGVTFDSGGISLKPGLNMHEMKQDMAGSAVVLATMITAARLKLKINLVGLIPATENMPSGSATRPGDILTARNGKTIEVINTDAEGRLILADALDYADKFNPQAVIDIATLTGASLYVLGYSGAPIMGNDDGLLNRINDAADETAERVWPLPIWDDMREQMKSSIADLVNSGGRPAGTIAAAAFLENFVGDWPWAHVDIAYVDLEPKGRPYVPKGATGFGLRLFIELLSNWKKL